MEIYTYLINKYPVGMDIGVVVVSSGGRLHVFKIFILRTGFRPRVSIKRIMIQNPIEHIRIERPMQLEKTRNAWTYCSSNGPRLMAMTNATGHPPDLAISWLTANFASSLAYTPYLSVSALPNE